MTADPMTADDDVADPMTADKDVADQAPTPRPPTGGAAAALDAVTGALEGAERREGQRTMADLVATAIAEQTHLVVQAGTGTGKTLAYLVPAALAGTTTVIVTATKALQDQLASKDLPFVDDHLDAIGVAPDTFRWAILKGRSNYVCRQRLAEIHGGEQGVLQLDDVGATVREQIVRIAEWATSSDTGDQADLPFTPADATWREVSVGSDECPGASKCPHGSTCFAEQARAVAQGADVVVVNAHLYGLHIGRDGMLLPDHDLVVFDEAHVLEDVISDTAGVALSAGRLTAVSATVAKIVADSELRDALNGDAASLTDVLANADGQRLDLPLEGDVATVLRATEGHLHQILRALEAVPSGSDDVIQRRNRAQVQVSRLLSDVQTAFTRQSETVAFVAGTATAPRLVLAPLDVSPILTSGVWNQRTAVLTSATLPASLPRRLGLPVSATTVADVGSPFDYDSHGLLYCALGLPDPRDPGYREAVHDELEALIRAAGGRTLALFTSYRAMDAAADELGTRLSTPVLKQRSSGKSALVKQFAANEAASLFATAGFFQGVDVPGRTLSLVTIDRLPFPRPDDPLLQARREQLGPAAFSTIDVPRAATMLAQAAGRLIRTADDRGVVAVLDRRLGTARYRWDIVNALPPMRRTRHRADAEEFLREITA